MYLPRLKTVVVIGVLAGACGIGAVVTFTVSAQPRASGTALLSAEQFERVAALVRPLPGEYAWRDEIPWEGRIQAARIKAAAQDKPILILASANAFALGRT